MLVTCNIKTFLGSSMCIERLAGLALMHLHNDLDIDEDVIYKQAS